MDEQQKFGRSGMLKRDKHEKIDYHVARFVDLDDIW